MQRRRENTEGVTGASLYLSKHDLWWLLSLELKRAFTLELQGEDSTLKLNLERPRVQIEGSIRILRYMD